MDKRIIIGGAISALSLLGIFIIRSFSSIAIKSHSTTKSKKRPSKIIVKGWGSNSSGQMALGHTGPGPNFVVPIPEFSLISLKSISCGPYHALALTTDGKVYGCGSNSYSKLCCDESVPYLSHLKLIKSLSNVIEIATGPSFCLALTNDKRIFSWGSNNKGCLGIDRQDDFYISDEPVEITSLRDKKILHIYAGGSDQHDRGGFAFAVSESGLVYSWGSNLNGLLGIGTSKENRPTPTLVPSLKNIVQIALGVSHGLALTSYGQVKSWGTNPNGLGYAFNIQDDGIPQMVYELKNKKVIQIAASGDVSNEKCALSLALTEDGKVYCWGSNEESGPSNNNIIPTSFPSMINFSGKKITSVYSGSLKALVMTESGVLYVWGNTGLARIGKSNVPIELTEFKGQEVLDVFSDHDNVFVLCQE